jgi:hypothetical protein
MDKPEIQIQEVLDRMVIQSQDSLEVLDKQQTLLQLIQLLLLHEQLILSL